VGGTRGARPLERVLWLARAFAGVAGAVAAAEALASGLGPLLASLAAAAGFGVVYAVLLAGIRGYARLIDRAGAAPEAPAPAPDTGPSAVPRLIRTRRREGTRRRLMAPETPPEKPHPGA